MKSKPKKSTKSSKSNKSNKNNQHKSFDDPFYAREAQKYDQPIPSREYLAHMISEQGAPMKMESLVKKLKFGKDPAAKEGLARRLAAMVREGQLLYKADQYSIPMQTQMTKFVGKVVKTASALFVTNLSYPSQAMVRLNQYYSDLNEGDIVVVALDKLPGEDVLTGHVVLVVPDPNVAKIAIFTAIFKQDLPYEWSEDVTRSLKHYDENTLWSWDEENRTNLEHLEFVTIDGEDAKDFDDAVYCEPRVGGGHTLWVAIADVSYYVREGSVVDKSAKLRGTSVYFPGFVVPMLPEILSNGLCSLKANVRRLAMVCKMEISPVGEIESADFDAAVICSKARLTYTQVAAGIADPTAFPVVHFDLKNRIAALKAVYESLKIARAERGAMDFESTEIIFKFDAKGEVEKLLPTQRNVAHQIIEECMLAANMSTARFLQKHNMPMLYRVHRGPTPEKLAELKNFLAGLGYVWKTEEEPTPFDYQKVLQYFADRPESGLVNSLVLRSMSQAIYTAAHDQHFGLNYSEYVHFTSPIRRYPDLMIHRAIKAALQHKEPSVAVEALEALGQHCSITERRADEASREVANALKCHYMQQHLGDAFWGVITGVTPFGLFLQLEEVYAEGLLHISALADDYYMFDPGRLRLVGEHTGQEWHLGDKLLVRVVRCDLETYKIDFILAEAPFESIERFQRKRAMRGRPQRRERNR